jgi:hypothetical protein
MNTKYFIWIVGVTKCLWCFSWKLWNFPSIFGALKQLLEFSGIVCALKSNFRKKQILSYPTGPSPKARPAPPRPSHGGPPMPIWAYTSAEVSMAGTLAPPLGPCLGMRATTGCVQRPYKGGSRGPRAPCWTSSPPHPILCRDAKPASAPPSPIRRGRRLPEQIDLTRSFVSPSHIPSANPRC